MLEEKIGHYLDDNEILAGGFTKSSISTGAINFVSNWRRCSMTADFWSRYFSNDFEHESASSRDFRGVVSFVLNELIENIGKYCDCADRTAEISFFFNRSTSILKVSNFLTLESGTRFLSTAKDLFTCDIGEVYIERLERNLEEGEGSGMGYLTMINDYGISLGFHFSEDNGICKVTISAKLDF